MLVCCARICACLCVCPRSLGVNAGVRIVVIMLAQVIANCFVHYEIDAETTKHHLLLEQYGGQENGCWMLLKEKEA